MQLAMSTSNTKSTPQTLLATFLTLCFLLLLLNKVNSSDNLSFNFKKFDPNGKDLIIQGNASVSPAGVLRLTKVIDAQPIQWSVGKALYAAPLHIWDYEDGRVASFVTRFRFRMEAPNQNRVSDGLTFFLAPLDTPLRTPGGYFSLFNDDKCDTSYQIVAVEFDTHGEPENPWDPYYQHIGIDVNCLKSDRLTKWVARYGGEVADVEIRYDASTKTLTASLVYPFDESSDQTSIIVSAQVDVKAILPEWVTIGFTATTADVWFETHDVLSWEFASTLEANYKVANLNKSTGPTHAAA